MSPAKLVIGDLSDLGDLEKIIATTQFSTVLHFASSIVVPESVEDPLAYYNNNVVNTIKLFDLIHRHRIPRFIFSSSAAVYGITDKIPVSEVTVPSPISPYGRTKLIAEWVLQDLAMAGSWFSYGILRYFNVAGRDPKGCLGQNNPEATHLIKLACQAALGQRPVSQIYGQDYPTVDGTGVRDFIHVMDFAQAHVA